MLLGRGGLVQGPLRVDQAGLRAMDDETRPARRLPASAPATVTVYDICVQPRQVALPRNCPHCNAGVGDGRMGALVLRAEHAWVESPLRRRGRYAQRIQCGECRHDLVLGKVQAPWSVEEVAEAWAEEGRDESLSVDQTVEAMRRYAADGRPRDDEGRLDGALIPAWIDVDAVERAIRETWGGDRTRATVSGGGASP